MGIKKFILIMVCLFTLNQIANAGIDQNREDLKKPKEEASELEKSKDNKEDSIININNEISKIAESVKPDTALLRQLDKKRNEINERIKSIHEEIKDVAEKNNESQSNFLSIAILIFGLTVILGILAFQRKKTAETNFQPFKLIGIMFIGTITVFLIPAGFSNTQITPIIGLLGTLAGYLVGSSNNNNGNPFTKKNRFRSIARFS